jgi:signal peptidase I
VILFESPYKDDREFVKRLIGLPGDRILIQRGDVYVNDQFLDLPGVNVDTDYSFFGPITVPSNNYFVLGDNRGNSADSRVWGFVPKRDLIGIAEFIYWPPARVQVVH